MSIYLNINPMFLSALYETAKELPTNASDDPRSPAELQELLDYSHPVEEYRRSLDLLNWGLEDLFHQAIRPHSMDAENQNHLFLFLFGENRILVAEAHDALGFPSVNSFFGTVDTGLKDFISRGAFASRITFLQAINNGES